MFYTGDYIAIAIALFTGGFAVGAYAVYSRLSKIADQRSAYMEEVWQTLPREGQ
jgi:hypothetical protein